MKYILLIVGWLILVRFTQAQECGTTTVASSIPNTSVNTGSYWVRVYYHIVRASNQTGGSSASQLCDITTRLNQDYNRHGIYFAQSGYDYIDNDNFYNLTPSYDPLNTNTVTNAINIYLINSYTSQGTQIAGCAKNIQSSAFWVVNQYLFNGTLSHEMGHCLGLYHTHRGNPHASSSSSPETQSGTCEEDIRGSNCSSCGDYICDTPASPNLVFAVDGNCNYTNPSGWDQNGIPLTPDTRNFMSYSLCRSRFSSQQAYAMKNALVNGLSYVVDSSLPIPSIGGPDHICSSASYSVSNIASGYSLTSWTSSDNGIASIDGGGGLSKSGDGPIVLTATLSQGCTNYYAYKSVYVGLPLASTGVYTYGNHTYPVNNPSTGIAVDNSSPYITINLTSADPTASFNWNTTYSSGYSTINTSGGTAYLYMSTGASRTVASSAANSCGTGPTSTFNCYNYTTGYRMIVYPNPVNSILNVTAKPQSVEEAKSDPTSEGQFLLTDDLAQVEAVLLDKEGVALRKGTFIDQALQIDTQKIPEGVYYLHIGDQTNTVKLQIVVQH